MSNKETYLRERTSSTGSLDRFLLKRKREAKTSPETETLKSPTQTEKAARKETKENKSTKMNETQGSEILKLMKDMKQEITHLRKENLEKNQELQNEIRDLKEQLLHKEAQWKEEKEILNEKINQLENWAEKQEKIRRKNNIIINGDGAKQLENKQAIQEFIGKELGVQAEVEEAYIVKKNGIEKGTIVKLRNFEQKREVMANKKKLNGTKIFIENDMTWKEREIQWKLRQIKKEKEMDGGKVVVGYQKILIKGKWMKLNEKTGSLEEASFRKQ